MSSLPEEPEWTYEIKLDGYRAQALCDGGHTQLFSRNGKELGQRFPGLLRELARAVPHGSIVDGELVALDPSGKSSFSLIQNSATILEEVADRAAQPIQPPHDQSVTLVQPVQALR